MPPELTKTYDTSIIIGRFSPIHLAHYRLIRFALSKSKQVVLIIGSDESRTKKNPWLVSERIEMIISCFTDEVKRMCFLPIKDLHDDEKWKAKVLSDCQPFTESKTVALVACNKDRTSYYLDLFKEFDLLHIKAVGNINGTDIRESFFVPEERWGFIHDSRWKMHLDHSVIKYLERFRKTPQFQEVLEMMK
jgi:bifunctional NMN adenylyltransferase/nudix hydrolase